MHQGDWLRDVTAAQVKGSEIVPLDYKLYSAQVADFTSDGRSLPLYRARAVLPPPPH